MSAIRVAVVNKSRRPNTEVRKVTAALRTQLQRDFCPAWAVEADVEFFEAKCRERIGDRDTDKCHVPVGWWWLIIRDEPVEPADPNRNPEVSGLSLLDAGQLPPEETPGGYRVERVLGRYEPLRPRAQARPVAAVLGRHAVSTPGGLPVAVVYADVADTVFDGVPGVTGRVGGAWAGTASHELLEMLVNPWNNRAVSRHDEDGDVLAFYALEVCDPCQRARYPIDGVNVSAFVRPSFFESRPGSNDPLACGTEQLTSPFVPEDGGYVGVFRVTGNKGWQLLTKRGQVDRSDQPNPLQYRPPRAPATGVEPDVESVVAP